jgi:alkylhydroperoxidase/carboxymuconolactone decarboxylase family protein YurZ
MHFSQETTMPKKAPPSMPVAKKSGAPNASTYGYPWGEWLAREDPQYAAARQPLSAVSFGAGKELSIKHKEMVVIGILAFRGSKDGVVAHMRRAVEHGATKRELLEAVEAAAVPGGGPTLSAGVQGLMQLEAEGAFLRG